MRQFCCPSGGIGRRTGLKILRVLKPVPVQVRPWAPSYLLKNGESNESYNGGLAQLVRASALQAGGHRFESCILHHCRLGATGSASDL